MLSIIVPIFRNAVLVEYCLSALSEKLPADAELIVVDDASGQETVQILKKFSNIRLIEHEYNKGNTVAYNTGAAAARGDFLVFVDSDVFVPDGAFEEFSRVLSADNRLGAVGNLLLYPQDYTIQHAGVAFDKWTLSHIFTGRRREEVNLADIEERQAVTAAFFACRRAVFEEIGGFEETYRDGMEDIEFCLRCRELGYKNVILSRFPAMHLQSATRGPYIPIRRTYNYSIFFSRWTGRFQPDLCDFLKADAKRIFADFDNFEYSCPVINFCSTPNWIDFVQTLSECGLKTGTFHNLSGSIPETENIDLFRNVPIAFQRLPEKIVFVVDHFEQLKRNRLWFSRRSVSDIVVDRHANVLTGERFGFNGGNF